MALSKTTKDLLMEVRKFVPPMLPKFHKGQMGRIAVIGGSENYTGAPYFSAMASAKLGCDMSHIICEPHAAQVIKTYSPNLMVHPYMRQSAHAAPSDTPESIASTVIAMLPRLHVLVIGPGLGRDTLMQETCALIIQAARKQRLPIVLDADGLYLIQSKPGLIEGYQNCILTPNIVEFERLAKALNVDILIEDESYQCERLAIVLRGVTIIKKGSKDYISNGRQTLVSDIEGGLKRSGGQGDTLTGLLATLLGWRKAYIDQIWDHEDEISYSELLPLVAFGGSSLTRECSRLAFEKKGRSMQASDLTEEIAQAFQNLLEDKD